MIKEIKGLKEIDKTRKILPDATNSNTKPTTEPMLELQNQIQQLEQRIASLEQILYQQNFSARITQLEENQLLVETWEKRLATLEANNHSQISWPKQVWQKISQTKFISWSKIFKFLKYIFFVLLHGLIYSCSAIKKVVIFAYRQLGLKKAIAVSAIFLVVIGILYWQPWQYIQGAKNQTPDNQTATSTNHSGPSRVISFDDPTTNGNIPQPIHNTDFSTSNTTNTDSNTELDEDNLKNWISVSQSPDDDKQLQAILELAKMDHEKAYRRLTQMLQPSKSIEVRIAAAKALTSAKQYQPACDALANILNNSQSELELKIEVAETLGKIGSSKDALVLMQVAKKTEQDENLRMICIHGIDSISARNCAPDLIVLLNDSSPLIREAAAGALGSLQYPNAANELISCMKQEQESMVKIASIRALGNIDMKANLIAKELLAYYPETDSVYQEEIRKSLQRLNKYITSPELREQISLLPK